MAAIHAKRVTIQPKGTSFSSLPSLSFRFLVADPLSSLFFRLATRSSSPWREDLSQGTLNPRRARRVRRLDVGSLPLVSLRRTYGLVLVEVLSWFRLSLFTAGSLAFALRIRTFLSPSFIRTENILQHNAPSLKID